MLISAGSNLGDRKTYLAEGLRALTAAGLSGVACASVYETPPWGFEAETPFYNTCFSGYTDLSPTAFIRLLKQTEERAGRVRTQSGYVSRTLDLDIILWDRLIITAADLRIPHPRAHLRRFVLEPAAEIAPGWVHPVWNADLLTLLGQCTDASELKKVWPPLA